MPNDMTLHPKPRDAIENMLYPYTSLGKFYNIVCCLMFNVNSNFNLNFFN